MTDRVESQQLGSDLIVPKQLESLTITTYTSTTIHTHLG
jgi:hypothetical protein